MPSPAPILVVDDEPTDTYFLRRALKQAGIPNPVIGCADGEEAVSFLESAKFGGQRPCLIFLDMKMPRMNGPEFLAWIRGHAEFADLKIIVLSSSARPEDRSQALALGAHEYMVKFPTDRELATNIAGALADCTSTGA
jgi:CheY-like chemotaxis protein